MNCRVPMLSLICLAFGCGAPQVRRAPDGASHGCDAFDDAVRAFDATLLHEENMPPRADPERSPAAADRMIEHAEACLRERGQRYTRAGRRLTIAFDAGPLGTTAAQVTHETAGSTVYDGDFFLERPYAAASFDWQHNMLYLPHAAILGRAPSLALSHELFHVRSDGVRRRQGPRVRHIVIRHPGTEPNALEVDEVFAYALAARGSAGDDKARARSRATSSQYLGFTREALNRTDAVYSLRGGPDCRVLGPAARARIEEVLSCVERCTADPSCDVLSCDDVPMGLLCPTPN